MNQFDELAQALRDIDLRGAIRLTLGKCPLCNERLVVSPVLRWCENRRCAGHCSPRQQGFKPDWPIPHPHADVAERVLGQLQEKTR